jgi:hypothetical protein
MGSYFCWRVPPKFDDGFLCSTPGPPVNSVRRAVNPLRMTGDSTEQIMDKKYLNSFLKRSPWPEHVFPIIQYKEECIILLQ